MKNIKITWKISLWLLWEIARPAASATNSSSQNAWKNPQLNQHNLSRWTPKNKNPPLRTCPASKWFRTTLSPALPTCSHFRQNNIISLTTWHNRKKSRPTWEAFLSIGWLIFILDSRCFLKLSSLLWWLSISTSWRNKWARKTCNFWAQLPFSSLPSMNKPITCLKSKN